MLLALLWILVRPDSFHRSNALCPLVADRLRTLGLAARAVLALLCTQVDAGGQGGTQPGVLVIGEPIAGVSVLAMVVTFL